MKKSKKIRLTDRDKKILHHLFENRMATNRDIETRFFRNGARRSVTRRLIKLRKAGLIDMDVNYDLKSCYFYFLQQAGFKKIYPEAKYLHGVKLKSPNVAHDFSLIQLKNLLEKAGIVQKYYTENMLMLDLIWPEIDNIFEYDQGFRPDALFIIESLDGEKFYNAVELELNKKSQMRYSDKIQRYYLNEKISFVLFISSHKSIEKKVMSEEKNLYPEGNHKFYYGNFHSLMEKKLPFIFRNSKGIEFKLF